jgi:hypothetical protein
MPQLQGVWRNRPRLRSKPRPRSHKRGRSCHKRLPVWESPVTAALRKGDGTRPSPHWCLWRTFSFDGAHPLSDTGQHGALVVTLRAV